MAEGYQSGLTSPRLAGGTVLPARGWPASPRLAGLGPENLIITNMYYVYLLYSETLNKIYKGTTSNLKNRFNDHNNGKVKSTKNGRPWILVYYEAFINKTDCLIEEKFLKSGKGKERIKYLLQNYFKKIMER